jgi:hypothetical protein
MTTFTMQDLNNGVATPEEEEALQAMAKLGGGVEIQVEQNAPTPQPTLCESTQTDIPTIINTICTQLQLLSTVIKGEQARGNSQAEDQSLQETIALTLQQADWFEELVKRQLDAMGIEDIAESVVENLVERDVENYFDTRFDPSDHFDFNDAVQDAVSDQIDDVVRDKVMDSLEEVVAEKLSDASVSISF